VRMWAAIHTSRQGSTQAGCAAIWKLVPARCRRQRAAPGCPGPGASPCSAPARATHTCSRERREVKGEGRMAWSRHCRQWGCWQQTIVNSAHAQASTSPPVQSPPLPALTSWLAARLSPRQRPWPAQPRWQRPGCSPCRACCRCCRMEGQQEGQSGHATRPARITLHSESNRWGKQTKPPTRPPTSPT
jgi:hypothetical protein